MTTTLTPDQIRERSDRYADQSRLKLRQAQIELDQGDTAQASEKIYGALTNAVKACAELRGWNHYNHYRIELAITELIEENNQPQLGFAFAAAGQMHSNFFEDELEPTIVRSNIEAMATIIDLLEAVRQQPVPQPKPRAELTPDQRRRLAQLNQPPDKEPKPADQLRPVQKPH